MSGKRWRKHFSVCLDCTVRDGSVSCTASTPNERKIGVVNFTRHGMEGHVTFRFHIACLLMKICRTSVKIRRLNDLSAKERGMVPSIFPYIYRYDNIIGFIRQYQTYNGSFQYPVYDRLAEEGKRLLMDEKSKPDGVWGLTRLDGELFLSCKWRGCSGKHVVLANDKMFFSDLSSIHTACREERLFEPCAETTFAPFAREKPNMHLDDYVKNGGKHVLYFLCSPRISHAFELLGKCGLSYLADSLGMCQGLDLSASNVQEMFLLPLRCLRAFNNADSVEFLFEEMDRKIVAWMYYSAPQFFAEPFPKVFGLWGHFAYRNYDLRLPNRKTLGDILPGVLAYLKKQYAQMGNPYQVFALYQNYIAIGIRIGEFESGMYPKDLVAALERCIEILQARCKADRTEAFQAAVNRREYAFYEDEGDEYLMKRPLTPAALIRAGRDLHNCLSSYREEIACQSSFIMLMHRKDDGKLVGAIEISRNKVMQARGICNQELEPSAERYLDDYMHRKRLSMKKL